MHMSGYTVHLSLRRFKCTVEEIYEMLIELRRNYKRRELSFVSIYCTSFLFRFLISYERAYSRYANTYAHQNYLVLYSIPGVHKMRYLRFIFTYSLLQKTLLYSEARHFSRPIIQ
jgi:hypothetical protein